MKIVHLCLTGPYTDDVNYQENMLTKYQKKAGNEVHIIASKWYWSNNGQIKKINKSEYINNDNVFVHRLDIKNNKGIYSVNKRFTGLISKIEYIKPDIIFIHNIQFMDILKVMKYKKNNTNIKIFVDNHSDFSNSARKLVSKLFYKICWKRIARKIEPYVETFWGVLPVRVNFLENIYKLPSKKCELLLMGVDDEVATSAIEKRRETREKLKLKDSDFLIVTGGKIDNWKKETLNLMDAVHKINNENVKLIIFGSIIPELKDEVKKRLNCNISFLGWLNSDETADIIAAGDLAVFPGRHSVLWEETAGIGIPMFCRYWKGTNDIDLNGNMEYLNEGTYEEILEKLNKVLNDKEKYSSMKKVAQKKKEKFLYSKIAKKSIISSKQINRVF